MLSLKKMSGTESQTVTENIEVSIIISTARRRIRHAVRYILLVPFFFVFFLFLSLFLLFLNQVERQAFVKRRLKSLDTFRG